MIFIIVSLVTFLTNSILGILIFIRNPHKDENRHFGLLSLSLISWIITLFFYYIISEHNLVLAIGRINFAVSTFIGYFTFTFVYLFPNISVNIPKKLLLIIKYCAIIIFLITLFTPLVDRDEIVKGADRFVDYGILYPLWAVNLISNLILGFVLLIIKLKRSKGVIKLQLRYLFTGFLLFYIIAVTTNILMPYIFNDYSLQPFGPLATVALLGFISYAIIRHRLMDLRMIVARFVAYIIFIILLGVFYIGAFYITYSFFTNKSFNISDSILPIVLTVIIAFSFHPFLKFIEKITNRLFYKEGYDTDSLLQTLGRNMSGCLILEDLADIIFKSFKQELKISYAGIYVITKSFIWYKDSIGEREIPFNQKNIKYLLYEAQRHGKDNFLNFDEIDEGKSRIIMRQEKLALVIPLIVKQNIIGGFFIREKMSGEIFTSKDLNILGVLTPEMAIAVKNALSYQEIMLFNITLQEEVEQATEKIQKANRHLKELDRMKDEFVAVASHQLRSPLSSMRLYLDKIFRVKSDLPVDVVNKLYVVYESNLHLINLVNDILDVSKIESGRIELITQVFDLVELINNIKDDLNTKAQNKELDIDIISDKKLMIKADKDKIYQVIMNLVDNAIKFSTKGGKIIIKAGIQEKKIIISVKDTGIGINAKDIGKLFSKFGRLNNAFSSMSQVPGTGLGLYICKKLTELMGGNIDLVSEEGKGSEFIVRLPKE